MKNIIKGYDNPLKCLTFVFLWSLYEKVPVVGNDLTPDCSIIQSRV